MNEFKRDAPSCGLPLSEAGIVLLAHGGGGKSMRQLLKGVVRKHFKSPFLSTQHDSAVLPMGETRIAFTTDTYVVRPIFFPGGDIGKLAIYGTVNDLAMSGARPLYLSVGLILEEGFPMESLDLIVGSMEEAAQQCGVEIVTGDTKVVERGKGDGIFINTSGVGRIEHSFQIGPQAVRHGDAVIVSGDLGRHGISIMAAREGLEFETTLQSDCAPLSPLVQDLLESGIEIHCLRDLTRGGLASALNEIAETACCSIAIEEPQITVTPEVQGVCELLGLDPLYVANEGRMVIFVPQAQASRTIEVLRRHAPGKQASWVGKVTQDPRKQVSIRSRVGIARILDLLSGEQLPRIC